MIGFSPLPFDAPQNLPTTSYHSNPPQSNKRPPPSSREELEQSWHSTGSYSSSARAEVLHSISCSTDEFDRSYKRQRTNESVDTSSRVTTVVTTGVRINPDNRPPKDIMSDDSPQIKAGWYSGHLSYSGNRHGNGTTKHDDGTSYTGEYANDLMEGYGKYTFTTMKQLVHLEGMKLHRVTDKVFEGKFVQDVPGGAGVIITTIVDSEPERVQSSGIDVKYVKVVYDVGYYNRDGKAVGEGARFTYTKTSMTDWKEVCTRLWSGEETGVVVGRSYGEWICDCLGMTSVPTVPSL